MNRPLAVLFALILPAILLPEGFSAHLCFCDFGRGGEARGATCCGVKKTEKSCCERNLRLVPDSSARLRSPCKGCVDFALPSTVQKAAPVSSEPTPISSMPAVMQPCDAPLFTRVDFCSGDAVPSTPDIPFPPPLTPGHGLSLRI